MLDLRTPGVYIEEVSLLPPSVAQVETAIPAFIGFTEKADEIAPGDLVGKAKRITSMPEFRQLYGGAPTQAITVHVEEQDGVHLPVRAEVSAPSNYKMANALELFYANGGGACYIISVGAYTDSITLGTLAGLADTSGLSIASNIDEVTLLVFPEATALDNSNYKTLYERALSQCETLQDRFTIIDAKPGADPVATTRTIASSALKYGAAYHPFLKTILTYKYDDDSITFDHADDLADFEGETLTAVKANSPALVTEQFKTALTKVIQKQKVEMPPSPLIAGVYAHVDRTRGVWKAPANVSLSSVIEPTALISDESQKAMNVDPNGKSVNAIRSFANRGTLVWGARTMDSQSAEWKYVNVRRFYNMVEESLKKSTAWAVFEPNDANTWVRVKGMIENYLIGLWQDGALAGAKPEDAFFVNVGLGTTMTAQDILEGKMIVEIGMAAVRPAEFIVLRFSHKLQES